MYSPPNADKISHEIFKTKLFMYDSYLPPKILGLEKLRFEEVLEVLEARREEGGAFLEKTEVTALVEWKLKHGTYRPNLAKLVAENSLQEIRTTTKNAFAAYSADNASFAKCVTALGKLRGIGPATASLLLSCYDPVKVPFFSDELFRYLHWSDAKSKGWDRKINYSIKEYKDLFEKTQVLRERLEKESGQTIRAIDIEKCAYAIAKAAQQDHENHLDDSEDDVLRPPSPKRRKRASPEPSQDPVSVCLRKGPRGSPTYDGLGYELDYKIISKSQGRPKPLGKRAMAKLDKMKEECYRKAEIMGVDRNKFIGATENACDDRVAKDLGLAFHEIALEEYEEWHRKGFRV